MIQEAVADLTRMRECGNAGMREERYITQDLRITCCNQLESSTDGMHRRWRPDIGSMYPSCLVEIMTVIRRSPLYFEDHFLPSSRDIGVALK
jgi:hypothetical protein